MKLIFNLIKKVAIQTYSMYNQQIICKLQLVSKALIAYVAVRQKSN